MMGNPPFETGEKQFMQGVHIKKRFWSQHGRSGQTVAADLSGPEVTGAPMCPGESSLSRVVGTAWDCGLGIRGVRPRFRGGDV